MTDLIFNENLFPCSRHAGEESFDLTEHLVLTARLVESADNFFALRDGRQRFSGFISVDAELLSFEIWRGETMLRALRIRGAGLGGVLYIDIDGPVSQAIECDILSDLHLAGPRAIDELENLQVIMEGPADTPEPDRRRVYQNLMKAGERDQVVAKLLAYLDQGP